MHLDTMSDLKEGDFVSEGDQLGTIGGSGAGIMKKYIMSSKLKGIMLILQ